MKTSKVLSLWVIFKVFRLFAPHHFISHSSTSSLRPENNLSLDTDIFPLTLIFFPDVLNVNEMTTATFI